MSASQLNFHHLRYFWEVARDGNLTRTAARLRVSPSALSVQIRQVEGQLGERLFARSGRVLVLTEAGRIALHHADTIFSTGDELVANLRNGPPREQPLRIGAVATLSRNFQESFVRPLLGESGIRLRLVAGGLDDLLRRLAAHELDVVLANDPVRGAEVDEFRCRRVARQRVSLVARPRRKVFRFPEDAHDAPFLLPGQHSGIRAAFDLACGRFGVKVRVFAEIDDMAMIRLLARASDAVALLPAVVVRDELTSGTLCEYGVIPGVYEDFYAVTVERRYEHPLVKVLLSRPVRDLLDG
jgi:LysR family transcriptional regulator, transcriptional activator of nhaA